MIGILTFQATNNFGAYLHAIALYEKIKELGYDCEVIDYMSPELIRRETESLKMRKNLRGIVSYVLFGHVAKDKYSVLRKEFKGLVTLSPEYTPANIAASNKRYYRFLLGSDVVWSLRVSNADYNYFLSFVDDDKRKDAFSSSVGETDMYRDDPRLPELLNRFNTIAVREEEAIDWVKAISGKDAVYVCDPTMLYTGEEWDKIIKPKAYKSDYVLMYFSDSKGKMQKDALAYAKKHGLKLKYIDYGRPQKDMEVVRPKSLSEFVGLIKHSQALFTSSYHGMLFGLYYQRELFYYNRSYKARIASLASRLGIEDHNGDICEFDNQNRINYHHVNEEIKLFRNSSLSVLKKLLSE